MQQPHNPNRPPRQAPPRQNGQPHQPNVYRARQSKARRRRRRTGLCVIAVLVVGLFVTALLLAAKSGAGSSAITSSASSAPPVASSIPAVASVPSSVSVSVAPPRQPTPYDEEGMPPLYNYIGRNFIPDDYELDLMAVGNGQQMQRRAAEAFLAMVEAAAGDGVTLNPLSGYRSNDLQSTIYYNKLNLYLNQGMTQEQAEFETLRYHAFPGTSEHEAGLAMDIGDPSVPGTDIKDGFGETPAFEWLQKHAAEFGFIFRYQSHTEDITGIAFEPWHYRYVGANHAEIINELEITLEEYIEQFYPQSKSSV